MVGDKREFTIPSRMPNRNPRVAADRFPLIFAVMCFSCVKPLPVGKAVDLLVFGAWVVKHHAGEAAFEAAQCLTCRILNPGAFSTGHRLSRADREAWPTRPDRLRLGPEACLPRRRGAARVLPNIRP